jgi:asparagine synthase (glutamine-hydrolysing)
MSGGLDSTSVAAIAVDSVREANLSLKLRAYTIDCRPLFDDPEPVLAACAARHLNIPIEILRHADWLPFQGWTDGQFTTPEPMHEPYLAFYREANRRVAKHAPVVFNGYGGDGVLTGQTWPYLVFLCRSHRPGRLLRDFGIYFIKSKRIPPLRGGFRCTIQRLLGGVKANNHRPEWAGPMLRTESRRATRTSRQDLRHHWYPEGWDTFDRGYWASIQENEDAAWTGVPLESRAPFLDIRVQRFLLRVPPIPLCIDKELLRRATKGFLPDQIRLRPKTPLAGDPLAEQIKRGAWSPPRLSQPSSDIVEFVDFEKLAGVLKSRPVSASWSEWRPLLLQYWLSSIEKA